MKKTFDSVAMMREAREKLSAELGRKSREEEIDCLRKKYAGLRTSSKKTRGTHS